MQPEEIAKILEIPEWDTYSAIKQEEASFLFDFITEKKITKTIETGFAMARSASHIIAATNSNHIAIDPFQDHYRRQGEKNIEKLGFTDKLTLIEDFSHNVLPKLLSENKSFEFIFIDGDHKFDGILVDFYFADHLLTQNGYVLFHDSWMRSTRLVEKFIKKNRSDYKLIKTPLRNFIMFQKVGEDNRGGNHFNEFFTLKSFITYPVIMWLTNGKKSFLKNFVFKLKDILKKLL